MGIFKDYIAYLKDNPEGLWFKRKLFGWGWVPVRWQGWVVVIVALVIFFLGMWVGEVDDAPGATLFGFFIMLAIIFYFGYKKGEKPKWQWNGDWRKKRDGGYMMLLLLVIGLVLIITFIVRTDLFGGGAEGVLERGQGAIEDANETKRTLEDKLRFDPDAVERSLDESD